MAKLQDALVAATAPAAFERLVAEKARAQGPDVTNEELANEMRATRRYIAELEDPRGIFHTADEFMAFFKGGMNPDLHRGLEEVATTAPEEPDSLHGNTES